MTHKALFHILSNLISSVCVLNYKNKQAMATLAWHLKGNAKLWFKN